jgi:hypothetical protein
MTPSAIQRNEVLLRRGQTSFLTYASVKRHFSLRSPTDAMVNLMN